MSDELNDLAAMASAQSAETLTTSGATLSHSLTASGTSLRRTPYRKSQQQQRHHLSTTSTASYLQPAIKDGFLLKRTEHYRLASRMSQLRRLGQGTATEPSIASIDISSTAVDSSSQSELKGGRGWKLYRAVLRGPKLYFYSQTNSIDSHQSDIIDRSMSNMNLQSSQNIASNKQSTTLSSQLTPEDIDKMWGHAYIAEAVSEQPKATSSRPSNAASAKDSATLQRGKGRKFWATSIHPELVISNAANEYAQPIIGGSLEGLMHEYLYRNVTFSLSAPSIKNVARTSTQTLPASKIARTSTQTLPEVVEAKSSRSSAVIAPKNIKSMSMLTGEDRDKLSVEISAAAYSLVLDAITFYSENSVDSSWIQSLQRLASIGVDSETESQTSKRQILSRVAEILLKVRPFERFVEGLEEILKWIHLASESIPDPANSLIDQFKSRQIISEIQYEHTVNDGNQNLPAAVSSGPPPETESQEELPFKQWWEKRNALIKPLCGSTFLAISPSAWADSFEVDQDLSPLDLLNVYFAMNVELSAPSLPASALWNLCPDVLQTIPEDMEGWTSISPMISLHPVSHFCLYSVLAHTRVASHSKRAACISHWIKIGEEMRKSGSSFWKAIASAILSEPVTRLRQTWKLLDRELVIVVFSTWVPALLKTRGNEKLLKDEVERLTMGPVVFYESSPDCTNSLFTEFLSSFPADYTLTPNVIDTVKRGWISVEHSERASAYFDTLQLNRKRSSTQSPLKLWTRAILYRSSPLASEILLSDGGFCSFSDLLSSFYCEDRESRLAHVTKRFAAHHAKCSDLWFHESFLCESTQHYYISSDTVANANHDYSILFECFRQRTCNTGGDSDLTKALPRGDSLSSDGDLELVLANESLPGTDGTSLSYLHSASQERLFDLLIFGSTDAGVSLGSFTEKGQKYVKAVYDMSYIDIFLCTYRTTCRPRAFLDAIKRRWTSHKIDLAHTSVSASIFSVGEVERRLDYLMSSWMTKHFEDFRDDPVTLVQFRRFAASYQASRVESTSSVKAILQILSRLPCVDTKKTAIPPQPATETSSTNPFMNIDQAEAKDIGRFMMTELAHLYQSTQAMEWEKLVELLSAAISHGSLPLHILRTRFRSTYGKDETDDTLTLEDLLVLLQSIHLPGQTRESPGQTLSDLVKRQEDNEKKDKDVHAAHTSTPFLTMLPDSISAMISFHRNLRLWTIHQVLSASSMRHRLSRIKNLIDIVRYCRIEALNEPHLNSLERATTESGNMIVRAIVSGLTSPQCRAFHRCWQTLHELPMDGVFKLKSPSLKGPLNDDFFNAVDSNVASAETYTEVLAILSYECAAALVPNGVFRRHMSGDDVWNDFKSGMPSILDIFEVLSHVCVNYPDYVRVKQDATLLVTPYSASTQKTGAGISLHSGLPLVNVEKKIMIHSLIKHLATEGQSCASKFLSNNKIDSIGCQFFFSSSAGAVVGTFITDLDVAIQAAAKENDSKVAGSSNSLNVSSTLAKATPLALFVKLVDEEKDLVKRRDKQIKRLESLLERENDRLRKSERQSHPEKSMESVNSKKSLVEDTKAKVGAFSRLQAFTRSKIKLNNSSAHSSSVSVSPRTSVYFSKASQTKPESKSAIASFNSVPILDSASQDSSTTVARPSATLGRPSTAGERRSRAFTDEVSKKTIATELSRRADSSDMITSAAETRVSNVTAQGLIDNTMNVRPVKIISLLHARAHVASDYRKRNFVFRILTEDEQELLLQAQSRDDMYDWIRKLNDAGLEVDGRSLNNVVVITDAPDTELAAPIDGNVGRLQLEAQSPKSDMSRRGLFYAMTSREGLSKAKNLRKKSDSGIIKSGIAVFGMDLQTLLDCEISRRTELKNSAATRTVKDLEKSSPASFWTRAKATVLAVSSAGVLSNQSVDTSASYANDAVPLILQKCIAEITKRGLVEVGIYRLSGSNSIIKDIKLQFDDDVFSVNLSEDEVPDINVVSGLLKLWLRELPNPLLTFELFDELIQSADIPEYDDRLITLKSLVHRLPTANYQTCKALIEHLEHVTDYGEINNMYATNLAIVFGPTLMRVPPDSWRQRRGTGRDQGSHHDIQDISSSRPALADPGNDNDNMADEMRSLGKRNAIVKNLILQYHWIFDVDDKEEDAAAQAATIENDTETAESVNEREE